MTRGRWVIAFFLMAVGGVCVAQTGPQSLADIARKNRSEKKIASTLTDDNFVRRTPSSDGKTSDGVPPADSMAAAGGAQSNPAGGTVTETKGDGKTDKAGDVSKKDGLKKEDLKKDELKKQLDSYKANRDAWNLSAKRYENLLANESDEFRRQMYQDALNNDRQNVSFYQKKIDETEAKTPADSGADTAKADQATTGGNKP